MNNVQSIYTPDYVHCCTVHGHHVFKGRRNGITFYSIDKKLSKEEYNAIIKYMINEGIIENANGEILVSGTNRAAASTWIFLT